MANKTLKSRPFLQVMFECCRVYQRIYRHRTGAYYEGKCPRCLRNIRFEVGPQGTAVRAFSVR